MKNNIAGKIISIILLAVMLAGIFVPANFYITAEAKNNNTESLIDSIIEWKGGSAQALADKISENMGNSISDWYAISLSRYKYNIDFSKCTAALNEYTVSAKNIRATDMQRIATAYTAMGSKNKYIDTALNNSIGKLGIMSYSYGLIMLDCGAYYGSMTRDEIINKILFMQLSDGGWGLMQGSDVDITAMTIQALARYYKYSDVKNAVDKALAYLSQRQQSDGDFKGYGTANAESTAQVLLALSTMKIDCNADSRFIKNGNTVLDGLLKYRRSDGSFSHTYGGDSNQLATVQALYALISLWRYENGKTAFFEFVSNNIQREVSQKPNTDSSKISTESSVNSKPISSSSTNPQTTESSFITSQESVPSQNTNQISSKSLSISENSKAEFSTTSSKNVENSAESKAENLESSETTSLENSITESNKSIETENLSSENVSEDFSTTENSNISKTQAVNYQLIIVLCLVGIFVAVLIVLIVRKKANKTNIIVLVIGLIALTAISLTLKIETPNQYYSEVSDSNKNTATVVMSISCSNAVGKTDKIPKDGIILDDTEFSISDGETVFDILVKISKQNKIQLDYSGDNGIIYIRGINGLYEFDCGELSGWIYKVNGETPNAGCSAYTLKDGDVIEWAYTSNLGKDLE